MDFTRKSWPAGWTPCESEINGNPNGLLRMDNCVLDFNGEVKIIQGTKKVGTTTGGGAAFSGAISRMYSRYMGSNKYRYAHDGTSVLRNYGAGASETVYDKSILTGGSSALCAFGAGFNAVLVCSGTEKILDFGSTQSDADLTAPSAPTVTVNAPLTIDSSVLTAGVMSAWVSIENGSTFTNSGDYIEIDGSTTTFRAISQVGTTLDTTNFGGSNNDIDDDTFTINVRVGDTSKLVKVRVEFLLETPETIPDYTPDVTNYYWYEWLAREENASEINSELSFNSGFRQGVDAWSTLIATRGNFNRVGNDDSKTWATVKGIRVICVGTESMTYVFNDLSWTGGDNTLNGWYEYKQVNVVDHGSFVQQSLPSTASAAVFVQGATTNVDPVDPAPATQVWIYRRGGALDQWYRVKVITGGTHAAFNDELTDADALLLNVVLNEYTEVIPDNVVQIEMPFFERALYMTYNAIYISQRNDITRCDSRHIIENCGSTTTAETNMFMAKVSEREIIIGTTADMYSLTGDGSVDPSTGLLNFTLSPLGVDKPPVSRAFVVEDNSLFYLASDGWRRMAGSSNTVISQDLEVLYRGEDAHGVYALRKGIADDVFISAAFSNGRLIVSMEHNTAGRILHVFHVKQKYWSLAYTGMTGVAPLALFVPMGLFVEEDGTVLCGEDASGGKFIWELFTGVGWGNHGAATVIPVNFRTVFDDFGEPRRRKDTFVIKLLADTGNVQTSLKVYNDGSATHSYAVSDATTQFNGITEKIYDVTSTVGKKKTFQLEITGSFLTFRFFGWTVNAELLPEQTQYLRIPATNFGVASRKRVTNFPFVIDTLGTNVTFTPIVDGSSGTTSTVNTSEKRTHVHNFRADTVGIDFGGTLVGTAPFEFYELALSEVVSEKMPIAVEYYVSPNNNYGTHARKRFNRLTFVLNARGYNLTIIPILDGTPQTPLSLTGTASYKKEYNYYFSDDTTATEIAFTIDSVTDGQVFEFYEMLKPEWLETTPEPVRFLRTLPDNMGTPALKRFNNIPFMIDTGGTAVNVSPVLDGVTQTPLAVTTSTKSTQRYYFTTDVTARDISLICDGTADFYFYGQLKPEALEVLPDPTRYLRTLPENFGTYARKRFNRVSFTLDTQGTVVSIIPVLDGVSQTPLSFTSSYKKTGAYFFATDVTPRDIGLIISGTADFYYYGMPKPEMLDVLPEPVTFLRTPPENFGTYQRKRFDNIPFVLDTRGTAVTVSAILDGTTVATTSVTCSVKKIHTISLGLFWEATDVSLDFTGTAEFEFYNLLKPERLEVLPNPVKNFSTPSTNYGSAGKKRVRTMPVVLDCRGGTVTYTPVVDGVAFTGGTFTGVGKKTYFHYFTESDGVVGVDFYMSFTSTTEFEVYEMLTPESVEILPVAKKFDQLGPLTGDRMLRGKYLMLNILPTGTSLSVKFYTEDTLLWEKVLTTSVNEQRVYEIQLPKGINTQLLRITLSSDSPFHRFEAGLRVDVSGNGTKFKTVKF